MTSTIEKTLEAKLEMTLRHNAQLKMVVDHAMRTIDSHEKTIARLEEELHGTRQATPKRKPGVHLQALDRAIIRLGRLNGLSFENAGRLVHARTVTAARICKETDTAPLPDDSPDNEVQQAKRRIVITAAHELNMLDKIEFLDGFLTEEYEKRLIVLD